MAGDNQQFCLRWNNHQSTLISVFDSLLESGTLVDCTLAAEGQYLKAHKVVLSACSPYLELLLSQHYEKHPIVILKDVKFQELKSMMDYMYRGEVNITQDQLATFLKAAESLQIKGLSESSGSTDDARDVGSTAKRPREEPPPRRPVPPHPQARLPHSSGLTIEPRRSIPHSSEMAPASPMKSREGSTSPVARKRRRRRPSGGDDASNAALSDSQLDTSNSCDLPPVSNQAQSTPISVPSILATPSASNNQSESDQPLETEALSRFPNTTGSELMVKTKMEPNTDQLIEPKTEYLEDINNEDSVEDLTLDDDDEMPGPSHADGSNQNFSQWQMAGDRSTDEVFMAAQEAVGAHRDSQGVTDANIPKLPLIKNEKPKTVARKKPTSELSTGRVLRARRKKAKYAESPSESEEDEDENGSYDDFGEDSDDSDDEEYIPDSKAGSTSSTIRPRLLDLPAFTKIQLKPLTVLSRTNVTESEIKKSPIANLPALTNVSALRESLLRKLGTVPATPPSGPNTFEETDRLSKFSWTKERCLKLIDEYAKWPNLWNPKDEKFMHKLKKLDAWVSISKSVDCSVAEARRKMESLLSSFRREKAKMAQNLASGEGNQKSYQSDWYAFKHFAFLMGKSWKSDPTAENDEEDETESDARDGPIKTDDKDTESENEDDNPEDESEDESMEVPLFEDPPSAAQKELPSETKNTDDAPDAPKLNEPQPQAHHDDDQEKNDQEAETSKTDEPDQVSQNSASTPEDASSTKDGEKKVVPLEAYVMKHCPSEFAAVGVAAIKVEYEEDEIIEESTALPALFAKSSSYKIDYHPMKSRFPINDLDSLEAFDKELQDNPETFSLLVEFLNLFDPSATPSRAARKRMRYMVSKSLLTNMNYKKHWKKPCMENRKITDAIFKSLDAEFDGKYDKNTVDSSLTTLIYNMGNEKFRNSLLP